VARLSSDTATGKRRSGVALRRAMLAGACALSLAGLPQSAHAANRVRISGLADVAFSSIPSLAVDAVQSQSVCLFSKSPPANNYSITASGSGPGGAFVLSSASGTLPFEVQWSDTPGQTNGFALVANQALAGQHSSAGGGSADDCSTGPASTASLIVILRSAALGAALSGTYTGTLNLLVAPE
jgi:hypothetical protein